MKKKFVIYEVWTRHRVVEADSRADALDKNEPAEITDGVGFSLCNWHAVPVDDDEPLSTVGGLNYRQIEEDQPGHKLAGLPIETPADFMTLDEEMTGDIADVPEEKITHHLMND